MVQLNRREVLTWSIVGWWWPQQDSRYIKRERWKQQFRHVECEVNMKASTFCWAEDVNKHVSLVERSRLEIGIWELVVTILFLSLSLCLSLHTKFQGFYHSMISIPLSFGLYLHLCFFTIVLFYSIFTLCRLLCGDFICSLYRHLTDRGTVCQPAHIDQNGPEEKKGQRGKEVEWWSG
jgi:hypothetical protein